MQKPLIHPSSEITLSLLMKNIPQSLLMTGPFGVGLGTLAQYIAHTTGNIVLTVLPEKDDKIDIDKGVISIDSIRQLYDQTRSIQAGTLVIVIDYAERMGHQAQNAFLKLLEEPGSGVHFIVATHTPAKLLATIQSRTQQFDVRPLTNSQSVTMLDDMGIKDTHTRAQLLFMANGLPAELTRLGSNEEYFKKRSGIMRDARDLLQATTYKKLVIANAYKDDRQGALSLLTDASAILRHSIRLKPQPSLIAQIDSLLFAYDQIKANGNIRLCLARLVV